MSASGASAKENVGVTRILIPVVIGLPSALAVQTFIPAWPNTSNGPVKSMICTPSKIRMPTLARSAP